MKIDLKNELDAELQNLYHNSTPRYPELESDYEQDLFQGWFSDTASMEIEDLKHDEIFGQLVKDYGPVYQYGRGGRTLAPSKLIIGRGGSSFRIATVDDLDLEPLEARRLLKLLKQFNAAVESWCKAVPEIWNDSVEANEWNKDIEQNKDKRRANITVYR